MRHDSIHPSDRRGFYRRWRHSLTCLLLILLVLPFRIERAGAFCREYNVSDASICHQDMIEEALGFLRPPIRAAIRSGIAEPDDWPSSSVTDNHFDNCNFDGGTDLVNRRYTAPNAEGRPGILYALSPLGFVMGNGTLRAYPDAFIAADGLGWMLHAVQDLYTHANWVEMGFTDPRREQDLVDSGLGTWTVLPSDWGPVRGDIVGSQEDLPSRWSWIDHGATSFVPIVRDPGGITHRLLLSGTAFTGPISVPGNRCPDTARVPHDTMNKDDSSRPRHAQAAAMAIAQTRHEWCRLLHLALDTNGYAGAAVPIGLMVAPNKSPHPPWTSCAEAAAGPIQVNVQVDSLIALDNGEDDNSQNGELIYILTLFTNDFRRSVRSQTPVIFAPSNTPVPAARLPAPLSLCMSPDERLIATIQGWDDDDPQDSTLFGQLSRDDDARTGVTYQAGLGSSFSDGARTIHVHRRSDNPDNQDIEARLTITNERTDADADGLTYCEELANGFNPRDPDSDEDGIGDGQEVRLDLPFGLENGRVTTQIADGDDRAFAVAVQPNGKIVTAGEAVTETSNGVQVALARYQTDGTPDPAFGTNGRVLAGLFGTDAARALALAPDGKIIVAGYRGDTDVDFGVWRFNADGTPDQSFHGLGFRLLDFGLGNDYGQAVLAQSDGKVIVIGFAASGTSVDPGRIVFALARFNDDGGLDPSFGNGGITTTPVGSGFVRARAATLQPDGKILVAGGHAGDFVIVRYSPDGVLDQSFGQNGIVELTLGGNDEARTIAALPDGSIAVAGYAGGDMGLVFLTPSGQICRCGPIDGRFRVDAGGDEAAYAIAVQSDGRLILAGGANGLDPSESRFLIARFAKSRFSFGYALDRRFGANGLLITSIAERAVARAVAIDAQRWFIVAGYARSSTDDDVALTRYMGAGTAGPAPDESLVHLPLVMMP